MSTIRWCELGVPFVSRAELQPWWEEEHALASGGGSLTCVPRRLNPQVFLFSAARLGVEDGLPPILWQVPLP